MYIIQETVIYTHVTLFSTCWNITLTTWEMN